MGYSAAPGAVISVSVEGVAASQRQIDGMAASMTRLSGAVQGALRSVAATAGLGGGALEIAQLSDQYTKLTSQLKLATDSQFAYAAAYSEVKRIAAESQGDLAATGVLYARIANGTRELGLGQQKVAQITEAVNLALRVSGATAEESASAQLQLSQAFAAGALRGEEFNAVNEAAPRLMRALADQIGVPVGALKQMASQGQITSQVLADALPASLAQLRQEASQVQTIGGAFTVLKNNVLEFTATSAQSNGTVALLTGGINLLANNLTALTGVLTTVTAVKAANWAQTWTAETYRKIAADQAARNTALAAAEADLARISATGAQAAATQAGIAIAREEMVARLGQANANVVAAQAAVEAAAATGAQSFALRTLRLATGELAAAEAARGAALAELAVLGQQQARVSAEIAAARTAEASATTALTAAQTGASASAGLAARAVGFLGGPVSALITVLGLGATAWALWGGKAKEASTQAAESYEDANRRIVKGLDEQIAKNERLLQLRNGGMSKGEAERNLPIVQQLAAASQRLDDINQRRGAFAAGAGKSETDVLFARRAVLEDIAALTEKMQKANVSQAAVDASGTALTDLVEVRERLTGVNKQYLDDLQKLQTAREKGAIGDAEYIRLVSQLATDTWKSSEAGKAATSAAEKEQGAYAQLVSVVREKIDATAQEAAGRGKLTESQKLQVALDEQLRAGKLKLAPVDKASYQSLLAQLAVNERVIASQQRAADGADAMAKLEQAMADARAKALDDARHEADSNEQLAATFGMTKAAIAAQELARMEDQLAQRASLGLTADEIAQLEQLIAAKKRSVAALTSLDAQEASKKAADDMAAQFQRASDQIGQALTDDIMRGGKSAAEYLQDLFRTVVLRPILSPIGSAIGSGLTGMMMPGAAAAGTDAGGAGLATAGSLFGMGGLSGSVMAGAGWMMGATTLSGSLAAAGSLMGTGTAAGMMSGVGMAAGALGPLALAAAGIYTLAKSLDHSGTPHTGGAATATAAGVHAIPAEQLHFERTAVSDSGNAFAAGVASSIAAMLDSTATAFGKTAGYSASAAFADDASKDGAWGGLVIKNAMQTVLDWQDGRGNGQWAPKTFADGEAGQKQYLAEVSASVRQALDGIGLPSWAQTMLDNLGQGAGLDEMAKTIETINATQAALAKMGAQIKGFSTLTDGAVSALVKAAGGIESLSSGASAYVDNFYSEEEKNAALSKQVSDALASVNLSMPTTRDGFRALIDAEMALGEQGAPAVAVLFNSAAAFAQLHPELQKTATAAENTAQALRDQASTLFGGVDSAFSVLQSVVGREKAALQSQIDAHMAAAAKLKSLSDSLHSTLDGMRVPEQAAVERATAQARIKSALAIAKAGGPLPDAASIKQALAIVSQDASAQFATYQDYLRDFYSTQNDIADLAKYSDGQLSVEEQSLAALQDQAKNLDEMLAREQEQINELKGINTTGLSLLQAVQGLHGALLAAQANPIVAATGAVNSAYQSALGRAPDAAGLTYWQQQAASGVPLTDIIGAISNSPEARIQDLYQSMLGRQADAAGLRFFLSSGASVDAVRSALLGSDEYKRLHPFAVGTNFVPETMPALVHQGERIIPAADNRALMARLSSPGSNSEALAAEVRALRQQNEQMAQMLDEALTAIARHTSDTKDTLDKWDVTGQPETRTA